MRKLAVIFLSLLLWTTSALAIEVVRQKNAATYIMFPIMKSDGTLITGATGLDSELNYFADGSQPQASFTDCTNEATEIGSTGQYYLSLTAAELNHDYDIIQIKSTSTSAVTQTILIRTIVGDPLNIATTDDGGTINVTGGAIDTVTTTTTATTATNLTNAATNGDFTATQKSSITTAASSSTPALSAAGVQAIFDRDISAWSGAGKFGTYAKAIYDKLPASTIGTSTLTAANVWDADISAYSGAKAGTYLKSIYDKLPAGTIGTSTYAGADTTGTTTLVGLLTSARAGYLDKLNVTGTLANTDNAASFKATGFSTHSAADVAALILATPANKLATDGTGRVTVGSNADKTDYVLAADQAVNVTKWLGAAAPAMSGDAYSILNNGTYGNNALLTAIGTRMATFTYTAPDNTDIGNIYAIVNSGTYGNNALLTTIGTRAPSSTALSNVTWTDAKAAFLDALVSSRGTSNYAGGPVESVTGDVGGDVNGDIKGNIDNPVTISTTLAY